MQKHFGDQEENFSMWFRSYISARVQFHYTFSCWEDRDVSYYPFVDNLQI